MTEFFAARSLAYETARGIDRGTDVKVAHAQCSMAKLYCSEMAGRVADRAVQVFGGRGYMRENVAERFYRELRVERIWEGTSEIQRAHHRPPDDQARSRLAGLTRPPGGRRGGTVPVRAVPSRRSGAPSGFHTGWPREPRRPW